MLSNPLHAIEEMQDVAPTDNSSDDGRENEEEFKALMKQTMHSDEWQEIKDENYGEFYFFNARLKVRNQLAKRCLLRLLGDEFCEIIVCFAGFDVDNANEGQDFAGAHLSKVANRSAKNQTGFIIVNWLSAFNFSCSGCRGGCKGGCKGGCNGGSHCLRSLLDRH